MRFRDLCLIGGLLTGQTAVLVSYIRRRTQRVDDQYWQGVVDATAERDALERRGNVVLLPRQPAAGDVDEVVERDA